MSSGRMRLGLDAGPQIEEAVRDYFERSAAERHERSADVLAELLELTRDFVDPTEITSKRWSERHLEVTKVDGDVAEVAVDATVYMTYESDEGGRGKDKLLIEGPVRLRRIGGSWRIADYVQNGRRRSDSIRLSPSGAQQVDGVTLSALSADLQGGYTMIYLEVENAGERELVLDWAALGIPAKRAWGYVPLGLLPSRFPPGRTIAAAWAWTELPLQTPAVRLVVVPKGKRVGFDFVVGLTATDDIQRLQPAPRALPLRLRTRRSALPLVPLLILVPVFLIGGWPALGVVLFALGALLIGSIVRQRLRGRRLPSRRPAFVGAGLAVAGFALFVATGIEFAGCPSRSEAGAVSDRFVTTLVRRGRVDASRYVSSSADPTMVPALPSMSESAVAKVVRKRTDVTAGECNPAVVLVPGADTTSPCFIYALPTRRLMVFMECDFDEWKVVGIG